MSDFQDPMNAWDPFGGFYWEPVGPAQDPLQDSFAPLELDVLAPQLDNSVDRVSFDLPQDQPEQPLVFEPELSTWAEPSATGTAELLAGAGVGMEVDAGTPQGVGGDGGVGPQAAGGDLGVVEEPGVFLESEGQDRLAELGVSFSLGNDDENLTIAYSSRADLRIPVDEQEETQPYKRPAPLEDRGWFQELAAMNRFRPESHDLLEVEASTGRPYDPSRVPKSPRLRGRAVKPFGGRARGMCKRCGSRLQGNYCPRCAGQFCERCGEPLTDSKCTNEFCPNHQGERCSHCGEEICACDR